MRKKVELYLIGVAGSRMLAMTTVASCLLLTGVYQSPTFAQNEKGSRCSDGIDNDGDWCIDGVDSDCGGTETDCSDGEDNDCDELIDSEDPDCGGGGDPELPQFTAEMVPADDYDPDWGHPWVRPYPHCPLIDSSKFGPDPECWGDVDEHGLDLTGSQQEIFDAFRSNWVHVPLQLVDCMVLEPAADRNDPGAEPIVGAPPFLNHAVGVRIHAADGGDGPLKAIIGISHWEGRKAERYYGQAWNLDMDEIELTDTGFILHFHKDGMGMVANRGKRSEQLAGYISLGDIVFTLVEPAP